MSEMINVMSGQVEEVNNGIAWLSKDIEDVKHIVQLLYDSQALSENRAIACMCELVLKNIDEKLCVDIAEVNKNINKLNKSVNDLMIESVNKKSTRGTRTTAKKGTRKNVEKRIVKLEDSIGKTEKPVNTELATAVAK